MPAREPPTWAQKATPDSPRSTERALAGCSWNQSPSMRTAVTTISRTNSRIETSTTTLRRGFKTR
jgi:hypothetical protein